MIYLDNSATTRPLDSVCRCLAESSKELYYNISSPYASALNTEKEFIRASETLASSLNADRSEIIFTSGGTESDNTALMCAKNNSEVIVSAYEHHAVLNMQSALEKKGCKMILCPVEKDGRISAETLCSLVCENTSLVSIMHVNNEIGAVNDIAALCCAVKKKKKDIIFHSDGVQAYMHMCADVNKTGVDMYSVSAHKVHGPKGAGMLYVRKGTPFTPFVSGGGQQNNRRSGTVNVPGIIAFAKAVEELGTDFSNKLAGIKEEYTKQLLQIPGASLVCENSAPNILSIAFEGVKAASLQTALENEVIVGKGSACTSRSSKISHVLEAISLPVSKAETVLRLSFGNFNSPDEAEQVKRIMEEKIAYLRRYKRK